MNIFVCSRLLDELAYARKRVIELINYFESKDSEGHTPLYFETQELIRDHAKAEKRMNTLVKKADAFVLIYYQCLGPGEERLCFEQYTPIQYEFKKFLDREGGPGPYLVLIKKADKSTNMDSDKGPRSWFEGKVDPHNIKEFKVLENLEGEPRCNSLHYILDKWLETLKDKSTKAKEIKKYTIRCNSPDYIGLISNITDFIFSKQGDNIDYVSHASRDGYSAVYLSCSCDADREDMPSYRNSIKKELESRLPKWLAEAIEEGRYHGAFTHGDIHVNVSDHPGDKEEDQLFTSYLEVHMIDTPGQLNAVCNVLKELEYNIDELVYMPISSRKRKRQRKVLFWISKHLDKHDKNSNPDKELLLLEMQMGRLVGVLSFSTEIILTPRQKR